MKRSTFISVLAVVFISGFLTSTSIIGVSALLNFPDVPSDAYFTKAVGEASDLGFITGYNDGNFGPNDPVTRGQLAVIMMRMWNKMEHGTVTRSSTSSSSSSRESSIISSSSASSQSIATSGNLFKFTIDKITVVESTPKVSLSITRQGNLQANASVQYETVDDTAMKDTDYTNTSGTVQFTGGETSKTITVGLKEDKVGEATESFKVRLKTPSTGFAIGAPNEVSVFINDNDGGTTSSSSSSSSSNSSSSTTTNGAGKLSLSALSYAVPENNGAITIRVVRTDGTNGEVKVDYTTTGDSANSSHFNAVNGTLVFAAGVTEQSFSVQIKDNNSVDGIKTVKLALKNTVGGASLGTSEAILTITDDEIATNTAGNFKFDPKELTVKESVGYAQLRVLRQSGSKGDVTVDYGTNSDTASSNADFEYTSTSIVFKEGETSKYIPIKILTDSESEPDELFTVSLKGASNGGTIGSDSLASITIHN